MDDSSALKSAIYFCTGAGLALAGLLYSSLASPSSSSSSSSSGSSSNSSALAPRDHEGEHEHNYADRSGSEQVIVSSSLAMQLANQQKNSPLSDVPAFLGDSSAFQSPEDQHFMALLLNIAEDQSRREGFVHRGVTCNNCNTCPIRGVRYKCANCVDFDLCENCEQSDSTHQKFHVFLKIKIPIPPLANPKLALVEVLYPGGKGIEAEALPTEKITELQKKSSFGQYELEGLFEQFKSLASIHNGEMVIDKQTFNYCLGPIAADSNLIPERLFCFFDQDHDNLISFSELVCGLSILCKGTYEQKIGFVFKGYDLNDDGYLSEHELTQMYKAYFKLSMELIRDIVRALEEDMVANFDEESDRPVSASFNCPIPQGESDQVSAGKTLDFNLLKEASEIQQGMRPVMEDISQEAIEELVRKTFETAALSKEGLLTFEEFVQFALTDTTIIAWFEAVGSVF